MAERVFQIKEDLLSRFCHLSVPPGARIKAQMTSEECKRTKDVANLRIHVESAFNRIKIIPHSQVHSRTLAALCNLKPRLIQAE